MAQFISLCFMTCVFGWPFVQEGQHPLTGQRAANFRLLANQWAARKLATQWRHGLVITHRHYGQKSYTKTIFLANVRYMLSPVRLSVCRLSSVVCNVRAPYSGNWNFRQYFCGARYLGHPLTSTENFTEIVPGEPLRRGSWTQEG